MKRVHDNASAFMHVLYKSKQIMTKVKFLNQAESFLNQTYARKLYF